MSRARAQSSISKAPHSISLKVLRLSKSTLAQHTPLPASSAPQKPATNDSSREAFALSPALKLPSSFGSVYVGETFSCTLCVNSERPLNANVTVSGVHLNCEMQTPSQPGGAPVNLQTTSEQDLDQSSQLEVGDTLQRIVNFDLREPGNHVLSVTVTYTETQVASEAQTAIGGKVRSFRKLYQFPVHQLLSVRTKTRSYPFRGSKQAVFVLEAQLENQSEKRVALEAITFVPRAGFESRSVNSWDMGGQAGRENLLLQPADTLQAMFKIMSEDGEEELEEIMAETSEGRVILGHLAIRWRGSMGEAGSLSTGSLGWRRR